MRVVPRYFRYGMSTQAMLAQDGQQRGLPVAWQIQSAPAALPRAERRVTSVGSDGTEAGKAGSRSAA